MCNITAEICDTDIDARSTGVIKGQNLYLFKRIPTVTAPHYFFVQVRFKYSYLNVKYSHCITKTYL